MGLRSLSCLTSPVLRYQCDDNWNLSFSIWGLHTVGAIYSTCKLRRVACLCFTIPTSYQTSSHSWPWNQWRFQIGWLYPWTTCPIIESLHFCNTADVDALDLNAETEYYPNNQRAVSDYVQFSTEVSVVWLLLFNSFYVDLGLSFHFRDQDLSPVP